MSGVNIGFKFDSGPMLGYITALRRDFSAANAKGLKRGFEDAGTVYLQFLRRRFQRASVGGGVWPRLKPSTVRQKHGNARILVRSGRLYGSLLRVSPDCVFAVDAQGLTIGTMVPYATYHQTGTGKMRKRQVYVRPDPPTRAIMASKFAIAVNTATQEAAAKVRGLSRAPRPAA